MEEETVSPRKVIVHPGRYLGWWAEGRYGDGRLFMKTWWPARGMARAMARLVGGGQPIQTTRHPRERTRN
jgi:hypothetical protein